MTTFEQILKKPLKDKQDLIIMLGCNTNEQKLLFAKAEQIRLEKIDNKVYGRNLIELSNICGKDCYYCGIRKSNKTVDRYALDLDAIKESIDIAISSNIGSIAIQSGELNSSTFVNSISEIVKYIKDKSPEIGITLSCGEQSQEVYKQWYELGAERYLLRIETSNKELYYKYHPRNENHDFTKRLECLQSIKDSGYQTGTGVMIGLPEQRVEDLAADLLFMRKMGIHMCGMGPFIPCESTPMEDSISNFGDNFEMSLRMIACLRIIMPDINIVASTAMETINPKGRMLAIKSGANVIMPNLNPTTHRKKYSLYNKKPTAEISTAEQTIDSCLSAIPIGYKLITGEKGNSLKFMTKDN